MGWRVMPLLALALHVRTRNAQGEGIIDVLGWLDDGGKRLSVGCAMLSRCWQWLHAMQCQFHKVMTAKQVAEHGSKCSAACMGEYRRAMVLACSK